MRTRTAILAGLVAIGGLGAPALALGNPVVADVVPLNGAAIHGNVTLFQLGDNENVGLNLSGVDPTTVAADIRRGTCKAYAPSARWPLGDAAETRLPNTHLSELVGSVIIIHKTQAESSAPVACAQITG